MVRKLSTSYLFLLIALFSMGCEKTKLGSGAIDSGSQSQTKYFNEYSCTTATTTGTGYYGSFNGNSGIYTDSRDTVSCNPAAQLWHIDMPNKEWCVYIKPASALDFSTVAFDPSNSRIFRNNSISVDKMNTYLETKGNVAANTVGKITNILATSTAVACLGSAAAAILMRKKELALEAIGEIGGSLCFVGATLAGTSWLTGKVLEGETKANLRKVNNEAQGTQNQAGSFNDDSTMMKILKSIPPTPNAVACPPVDKAIEIYRQQAKI